MAANDTGDGEGVDIRQTNTSWWHIEDKTGGEVDSIRTARLFEGLLSETAMKITS